MTTFEPNRLRYLADRHGWQTAADLETFLATDPKTKDDAALRERMRRAIQAAVPRLRAC